jgi:hypothetical protein
MNATSAGAARLLLLERRDTVAARDPHGARVRRYRLARVRLEGRPPGVRARFEHLKRAYD